MALTQNDHSFGLVQSLAMSPAAIPTVFEEEDSNNGLLTIPKYSHPDLVQMQRDDPVIGKAMSLLEAGNNLPTNFKADSHDLYLVLKEWKRLEIQNDLLYRKRLSGTETVMQLLLPDVLRPTVLQNLHDDMGHLGIERTLELVRSRFYWPKMAADVERKVKTCERCVRRKAPPDKAAPLVNIQTTRPMELVCMDFLSLEPDSKNTKDILVITDHFTKYAVAMPTRDQKASTVAKCLWEHFLVHYGFPERLHSDQGRDFESHTIRELCSLLGIRKVRTSPYHPRGNPVERYNRTLLSMLGTLKDKEKSHWCEYVKPLTHAYNCTKNDVTGFSPYELMFGRQPRLPIDIAFGLPVTNKSPQSHSQYVKKLKSHLEESYLVAITNSRKMAEKNKKRFDKVIRESTLDVGDRVLVRNLRLRTKHKLADKWEQTIYVITKKMGELPVYSLKPEKGDGPLRTLHRDLLLPCGFLSQTEEERPEHGSKPKRPQTRQSTVQPEDHNWVQEEDEEICYQFEPSQGTREVHFIKVYDTTIPTSDKDKEEPKKSEREPCMNQFAGPLGQQEALASGSHLSEIPTGTLHSPGTPIRETPKESSQHLCVPEKEKATDSYLPDSEYGNTTDEESEPLSSGNSDFKSKDSYSDLPPSMPDIPADLPDLQEGSSEQTRDQEAVGIEIRNQLKEHLETKVQKNDSEIPQPVRRSERNRQPSRRFHYPELGNPLVTVVKSLFQGLSTAFSDSLNADDRDWWSQSQAYEITTPILG
uniref:Gypsy retrotransposon integrase-like protein 1 n=1 Tax=Dicentrarchus labrax TaxID=13489 RepID=A0A8P4KGF2_DICLA